MIEAPEPPASFGVLFDIDDTLVDFSGAARSALFDVARVFGNKAGHDAQEARARVLQSWELVSEREYGRFLAGAVDFDGMRVARMVALLAEMDPAGRAGLDPEALELQRNESIFRHYRQYEDVRACLDRLSAAGVPVGVVSNSDGEYQRRKLAVAGLEGLAGAAVFSGDIGFSKPDPRIFRAGAALLDLAPERVVYVGDRWVTDAIGALSAGMAAVWVNRAGLTRPDAAAEQLGALPGAATRLTELPGLDRLEADLVARLVAGEGPAEGRLARIGPGAVGL